MSELVSEITKTKPLRDFHDHFYISMKHRYAFHTVGKAANSTVKFLLYKEEIKGTKIRMPSVHQRAMSPLISPYQLSDEDLERVLFGDEFFRFTFVRNPFSRLLSCYLDRIANGGTRPYRELLMAMGKEADYSPSFEEFINTICEQTAFKQNNHWRVQYDDTLSNVIDYHAVGKQEDFQSDFTKIFDRIFGEAPVKGSLSTNASPSKTSANEKLDKFWTDELRERVRDVFAADFRSFNYPLD